MVNLREFRDEVSVLLTVNPSVNKGTDALWQEPVSTWGLLISVMLSGLAEGTEVAFVLRCLLHHLLASLALVRQHWARPGTSLSFCFLLFP